VRIGPLPKIASTGKQLEYNSNSFQIDNSFSGTIRYGKNLQILPQNRYFSAVQFGAVSFSVPLKNITEGMSVKVIDIRYDGREVYPARFMSQSEYNDWLKKQ
jgi:hypothetical protein